MIEDLVSHSGLLDDSAVLHRGADGSDLTGRRGGIRNRQVSQHPNPEPKMDSGAHGSRTRPPRGRDWELATYVRHSRRRDGEVVTRAASIRSHCAECMGWDSGGHGSVAPVVRVCPASECWMWPWRNGPLDDEACCES